MSASIAEQIHAIIEQTLEQNAERSDEKILIDDSMKERLQEYLSMLESWTTTIDLVSQSSLEDMLLPHLSDSIAAFCVAPTDFEICVDVGSGAGLPGIVWSILCPERTFILIEPRKRRVDFLKEVRRKLGLKNLKFEARRLGDIRMSELPKAESVLFCCRALGLDLEFLEYARRFSMHSDARVQAVILAGPNWEPADELVEEISAPDDIVEYCLLAQGPRRRLPVWKFSS